MGDLQPLQSAGRQSVGWPAATPARYVARAHRRRRARGAVSGLPAGHTRPGTGVSDAIPRKISRVSMRFTAEDIESSVPEAAESDRLSRIGVSIIGGQV